MKDDIQIVFKTKHIIIIKAREEEKPVYVKIQEQMILSELHEKGYG
jgi:hypothetical protein